MISETLTPTSNASATTTLTKGNAQMAVEGIDGATGHVRLFMTVGGITAPVFETTLPRKAAKIIVVADETIEWYFEWLTDFDTPDNSSVNVYLGQQ